MEQKKAFVGNEWETLLPSKPIYKQQHVLPQEQHSYGSSDKVIKSDDCDAIASVGVVPTIPAKVLLGVSYRLTVELCVLLMSCTAIMEMQLTRQYMYSLISLEQNYTGPKPGGGISQNCTIAAQNNSLYASQQAVQASSTWWYTLLAFCQVVPTFFTTVFLGRYSDRAGRKVALLTPLVGYLVSTCLYVTTSFLFLPKVVLVLGEFFQGVAGSFNAFYMAAFSYMADESCEEKRSFRMVVIEACLAMGSVLASTLLGFIIEELGFRFAYVILFAINLTNLVYVACLVPNSVPKQRVPPNVHGSKRDAFFSCRNLTMAFDIWHGTDPSVGVLRVKLLLVLAVYLLTSMVYNGRRAAELLYFLNFPFCWSAVIVGLYNGASLLFSTTGSLLLTRALQRRLGDINLLYFGLGSGTAVVLTLANAHTTPVAFLGKVGISGSRGQIKISAVVTIFRVALLNPAHALHGGVSYFAFVCVYVCLCVR